MQEIFYLDSSEEEEENEIKAQVTAVFPTYEDYGHNDVVYLSDDQPNSSDECSSTTQVFVFICESSEKIGK